LDGRLTRAVKVEGEPEWTGGSGFSYNEAEISTLMEAVERYSNMAVDESRLIWSTYNDIKSKAINPVDLVLYSDEQYARNDFECPRFSVNSVIPWIQGYDLYSGKPVMIPADFVYYPAIREKPLVFDTSNGASAHTDTVQAILNGLFEVIERDSFLTMWLNRISMPIIDLKKHSFGFTESLKLINEFGMDVKLVDLTNDTRIPVIAAVCYNKNPRKYPALLVGTGSHIDPERAVQKALFEMERMLSQTLEVPIEKKVTSPDEISNFIDHTLYYLNPKMREYWEFMISGKQTSKLHPLAKKGSKDNYSTLMQIVRRLRTLNHRVIYLDITPSDIDRIGLKAVKVFVTGFQPLYVGNELRLNLARLRTSAEHVNRNIRAMKIGSELNSAPHPLP
jgi:ribosomal protein S12 methylthiotransferase accessory factor